MEKEGHSEGSARDAGDPRHSVRFALDRKPHPLDFDPGVYLRDDYLTLDFETTNLDKGSAQNPDNRVVLAVWRCGPTHPARNRERSGFEQELAHGTPGVFAEYGNHFEQGRLLSDIGRASFIVAHNAKFELSWLLRAGVELRDIICWCTQIAEYVLAGNRKFEGGLSLDATLQRYRLGNKLSYVRALIEAGVCPSTIPRAQLAEYCLVDVVQDENLFIRQRQRHYGEDLERVVYVRNLLSPMLAEIESKGVQLDEERVRATAGAEIGKYRGLESRLSEDFGSLNWRSSKQIRDLLYTKLSFDELKDRSGKPIRTPGGQPSTDEDTIGKLVGKTVEQKRFKELWGELAPLKKKCQDLEKMLGACKEDGGLIYAQFNQTVTQNHRLSSTGGKWGFQFQNQARSLRSLFRAREKGWRIVDGDCPQLEFRVAGDLGNDPVCKADVLGRSDIHKFSSEILAVSRQDAKPHTFKPLYGGRSGTKREREYYSAFRERYRAIYDTQMSWVYRVLEHKSLRTCTGLIFYWPDTEVTSSGYITNTPSIFNYPISMFATGDISNLSLLLVWHSIRGMDSFITNTVHDSGVLESPEEELDKVKEIMVNCYTERIYDALDTLYSYKFSMPLGLGIKTGEFWGEGKEEKYENEKRFKWTN